MRTCCPLILESTRTLAGLSSFEPSTGISLSGKTVCRLKLVGVTKIFNYGIIIII